jgi:hypothetical protein
MDGNEIPSRGKIHNFIEDSSGAKIISILSITTFTESEYKEFIK